MGKKVVGFTIYLTVDDQISDYDVEKVLYNTLGSTSPLEKLGLFSYIVEPHADLIEVAK